MSTEEMFNHLTRINSYHKCVQISKEKKQTDGQKWSDPRFPPRSLSGQMVRGNLPLSFYAVVSTKRGPHFKLGNYTRDLLGLLVLLSVIQQFHLGCRCVSACSAVHHRYSNSADKRYTQLVMTASFLPLGNSQQKGSGNFSSCTVQHQPQTMRPKLSW